MFLFLICLVVIPILPGMCIMRVFYKRNHRPCPGIFHAYLSGVLLCLLICGVINGISVLLDATLQQCTTWYCLAILWVQLLSGIILMLLWQPEATGLRIGAQNLFRAGTAYVKELPGRCKRNPLAVCVGVLFGGLVLLQAVVVCTKGYVYLDGDMTLETVQSFLESNSLYRIHPLTGQPYEGGVPLRIQILCLPTFYAAVCEVFGLSAQLVVWTVMPVYFLLCSYLVYGMLARRLFSEKALYRGYFLVLVALLVCWGTYGYGVDGLNLLYRGFRGESVRAGILLPYVLCQALDNRWILVLLCIGVELFVVWTLYGMGACLIVGLGFLAIGLVKKYLAGKSGKEVSACGK